MSSPVLSVSAIRRALAQNSAPVMVATLAASNVLRLVSNLVLTRLLAPEAFGVIGAISAVTYVLQMLTDMGYHAFVVRSHEAGDRRFLNVIWTLRLIRSFGLTALMIVFAGPLAQAFNKPELTAPIMATSFLFLTEGLRSLYPVTAERARRISYIMVIEFAVSAAQVLITIAAVLVVPSFWALIFGMYAAGMINVLLSYTAYRGGLHRIAFDRRISGELWRFSRVVVASSVITMILSQADKFFIGRTLTLETFGLYMLAVNLTTAALQLIRTYVTRIIFPLLAETARAAPETLARVYYAARRRMTLALAFIVGGGVGGGDLIVRILFDDRYLDAGVFVSLLFLAPLFMLLTYPADMLMVATGRIRSALEANVVRLAWLAAAAPAGYHFFGLIGLVAAFALIEFAAALYWWRRLKIAGVLNLREEALPLGAAALGAAIGFGFDALAKSLVASGALPPF